MKSSKNLKHQTLYIQGMHCSSCELVIEKYAKEQKGVHSADASLRDAKVDIYYKDGKGIPLQDINNEFKEQGYTFSTKKILNTPLLSFENGAMILNREKTNNLLKTLLILFLLVALFFFMDKLQLAKYIDIQNNTSLLAFFPLGLVAGISSCAALVGGLLLSLTKQWNDIYSQKTQQQKFTPHIMFHVGRIISFALLGGVLGLIGKTLSFNNTTVSAILVILVSVAMFILALQMLNISWANKIRIALPKSLSKKFTNEKTFSGKLMPFSIGVLTFFVPCGFTLIAQGVALTSGDFLKGVLIMLLFALGTLPMLLGISISGVKLNSKPKYTEMFNKVAGVLIVFFTVYNINSQMNILGLPSINDIKLPQKEQSVLAGNTDGQKQYLKITANGFQYIPTTSTTLQAGVPTTLVVDNQGIQGCATYMVGRGLFNGYMDLKPGENTITFTPKKGTYKITCSMGMVSPITVVVK